MKPRLCAAHLTDAEVRAAWHAGKPEPFSEDGIPVERALDEAGVEILGRFSCAAPVLWLALEGDGLIVVGAGDDEPMFVTLEDGPVVAGLRAQVAAITDALAVAVEPHDAATRELATKAVHALQFGLYDLRRMR